MPTIPPGRKALSAAPRPAESPAPAPAALPLHPALREALAAITYAG